MDISRLEAVLESATWLSAKIAHDGASNRPNSSEEQQKCAPLGGAEAVACEGFSPIYNRAAESPVTAHAYA